MDRVAVFADAGYLFAQGSAELCGAKLTRSQVTLDPGAVAAAFDARLLAMSRNRLGAPLDAVQKAHVREAFRRALDARLPEPSG